ncbi:MAG: hypothetical protein RMJ83_09725 [Armatimonadota bacterium]|nr:hypothetical protein [Armatimonadota bacterium]
MTRIWLCGWLLAGLLVLGVAQSETQPFDEWFVDRMHGFKVRLPEGWSVKVSNGLPIFTKDHCFVVVGATTYQQDLKEVARHVVRGLRTLQMEQPKLAFRAIPQGVQIVGEGLGYPYALNPMIVLTPTPFPTRFSLVGLILKGQKVALIVLFLFPEDTPASVRKEMIELVRTLEFLPASQRVEWKTTVLEDPLLGIPYGTINVPKGYTVVGTPMQQGTKHLYRYEVKHGNFLCRTDFVDLNTYAVMAGAMANATTTIIYNGNSSALSAPYTINAPEDAEKLLLAMWQLETNKEWKVVSRQVKEKPPLPAPIPMPMLSEQRHWVVTLTAQSGDLERVAMVSLMLTNFSDPHYIASTSSQYASLFIGVAQYPKQQRNFHQSVVRGIAASVNPSVEWSLAAFQAFTQTNKDINRTVLEYLEQRREDNSKMARTWTNALSDQTYIRDPDTGEVFKVYKRVWDTDNFWREPVFGRIIGTIGKETKLGELLKESGWKVMDESLAGFPE